MAAFDLHAKIGHTIELGAMAPEELVDGEHRGLGLPDVRHACSTATPIALAMSERWRIRSRRSTRIRPMLMPSRVEPCSLLAGCNRHHRRDPTPARLVMTPWARTSSIKQRDAEAMSTYRIPSRILVVVSIPRNSIGKRYAVRCRNCWHFELRPKPRPTTKVLCASPTVREQADV